MDKSLEMEKWEKRGKFGEKEKKKKKKKNPDLELSLRELKKVMYLIERCQDV